MKAEVILALEKWQKALAQAALTSRCKLTWVWHQVVLLGRSARGAGVAGYALNDLPGAALPPGSASMSICVCVTLFVSVQWCVAWPFHISLCLPHSGICILCTALVSLDGLQLFCSVLAGLDALHMFIHAGQHLASVAKLVFAILTVPMALARLPVDLLCLLASNP